MNQAVSSSSSISSTPAASIATTDDPSFLARFAETTEEDWMENPGLYQEYLELRFGTDFVRRRQQQQEQRRRRGSVESTGDFSLNSMRIIRCPRLPKPHHLHHDDGEETAEGHDGSPEPVPRTPWISRSDGVPLEILVPLNDEPPQAGDPGKGPSGEKTPTWKAPSQPGFVVRERPPVQHRVSNSAA